MDIILNVYLAIECLVINTDVTKMGVLVINKSVTGKRVLVTLFCMFFVDFCITYVTIYIDERY